MIHLYLFFKNNSLLFTALSLFWVSSLFLFCCEPYIWISQHQSPHNRVTEKLAPSKIDIYRSSCLEEIFELLARADLHRESCPNYIFLWNYKLDMKSNGKVEIRLSASIQFPQHPQYHCYSIILHYWFRKGKITMKLSKQ